MDALTIHCHVYNSTSPGFSVMKKTLVLSQPLFSSGICQLSTESTRLKCAFPEHEIFCSCFKSMDKRNENSTITRDTFVFKVSAQKHAV